LQQVLADLKPTQSLSWSPPYSAFDLKGRWRNGRRWSVIKTERKKPAACAAGCF